MPVSNRRRRSGAATVEFAVVAPIAFLLMMGICIGALGMFRYQEVARLARDASRWAAVHGADYATETGNPAATADDVYKKVIVPKAIALDLSKVSYSVTWNANNKPSRTTTVNGKSVIVTNTVSVTVTYAWIPETFLGPVTLQSTSVCTMSY